MLLEWFFIVCWVQTNTSTEQCSLVNVYTATADCDSHESNKTLMNGNAPVLIHTLRVWERQLSRGRGGGIKSVGISCNPSIFCLYLLTKHQESNFNRSLNGCFKCIAENVSLCLIFKFYLIFTVHVTLNSLIEKNKTKP